MLQERLGRVPPQYPHVKIYVLANSRFQECNQTAKFTQLENLRPVLLEVVEFTYETDVPHGPLFAPTKNAAKSSVRAGAVVLV